jgi:hypothetical protein
MGDDQCDDQGPLLQPLPAYTCSEAAVQGLQHSPTSSVVIKAFRDSLGCVVNFVPITTDEADFCGFERQYWFQAGSQILNSTNLPKVLVEEITILLCTRIQKFTSQAILGPFRFV